MTDSPRFACIRAVTTALRNNGAWGAQVGLDRADDDWTFPYVVIVYSGGGEANDIRRTSGDSAQVWVIKVVSDNLEEAATAAESVAALLNDKGVQDVATASDGLQGGDDWYILTCDRENYISFAEFVSSSRVIYHEGARYRFALEAV